MNFTEKVFFATKLISRGRVSTYGAIAREINYPKAVRAVGNALNKNPHSDVPCHRIVRSDGSVGGFARGTRVKINLLRKEGIKIVGSKVDRKFIIF